MMPTNATFGTFVLRPSWLQWFIDRLPFVAVNIAGYIWHDALPCRGLILALMIAMSLHLLYQLLYMKMTRFSITDEVIVYEHGVFCRSREYIELYRVVDFRESVSLMQQLTGLKTVTVYSGDRTTPKLVMPGMGVELSIVSSIRQRVEYNKRRKGIYEITNR